MSLKNKKEVIKHSAATQMDNTISLLQRRTWNILLANAFDDLPYQEDYQVDIKELCEVLSFDSNNLEYLKQNLKALIGCVVEWNILRKDKKTKWEATALLAKAIIEDGVCTYSYSNLLRDKLSNPVMYARINLNMQKRFNSKYALALYELCVDYFDIKRQYAETPFIDISTYRKLMGVKEHEYTNFKRLNSRVIKDPVTEINDKSDLWVEPEYKKEKRKVVAVKFHIKRNPKKENLLLSPPPEQTHSNTQNLSLEERLKRYGLLPKEANKYAYCCKKKRKC